MGQDQQKVCRKGNPRRSTGAMTLNPSLADWHHLLRPAASVFKPIRGIVCFGDTYSVLRHLDNGNTVTS